MLDDNSILGKVIVFICDYECFIRDMFRYSSAMKKIEMMNIGREED
jgi:hypothetical protein